MKQTQLYGNLLIVLGILFRCYHYFFNASLWGDEASLANNIITYDLLGLCTQTLDNNQAAPPGYLLIVKSISYVLGYSELSLRLFSLICGITALVLFGFAAKQLLSPAGSIMATLLFSFSPFLIYHSAEVKQYETEVLATTLVLYFVARYRYGFTYATSISWGLIFAVCIYFSNTSIFVLMGVFLSLFVYALSRHRFDLLKKVIVCGCFWSIAFIGYYILFIARNSNVQLMVETWQSEFIPFPASVSALKWYYTKVIFLFNNPLGFSLDTDFFPSVFIRWRYVLYFSYVALVLLILGIWVLWKKSRYLFTLLLLPIGITILASLFHRYPFHERFVLFLTPIVYLIISYSTDLKGFVSPESWLRKYPVGTILTSIAFAYIGFNLAYKLIQPRYFGGETKFSEYREAILYIQQQRKLDEPVYLSWNSVRFYDYYHHTRQIQWPATNGLIVEQNAHSRAEVEERIKQILTQDFKNHKRVWFLLQSRAYPYPLTDPQGNEIQIKEPMERLFYKVLQENGTIVQTFSGNPVRAYLVELSKK